MSHEAGGAGGYLFGRFGGTTRSALQLACARGHRGCVRMLLDAKASVQGAEGVVIEPPLFLAAREGHWEIAHFLIEARIRNSWDQKTYLKRGSVPYWNIF